MPDLRNDSSSSNAGFLDQLPPRPVCTDDMNDRAEIAYYIAGILTFLIVVIAIAFRPKEKWLTCRFKAEALRVFKFNMLCDTRLWTGHSSDRSHLESELHAKLTKYAAKLFAMQNIGLPKAPFRQ